MLFGKRERRISRILIVEDEPLVAFDNEYMLKDAGYEIVATVDSYADAAAGDRERGDRPRPHRHQPGRRRRRHRRRARGRRARGIAVLFVTGNCTEEAKALALGCLAKPYTERILLAALGAVDEHLQGRDPGRLPEQLTLYVRA